MGQRLYTVVTRTAGSVETRSRLGRWLRSRAKAEAIAKLWADRLGEDASVVVLDDQGTVVAGWRS